MEEWGKGGERRGRDGDAPEEKSDNGESGRERESVKERERRSSTNVWCVYRADRLLLLAVAGI